MTNLLTFYAALNSKLDASDLDFYEVNGQRIFPVYTKDVLTTMQCVVLTGGKNIQFTVDHSAARKDPFKEAERIMEIIKADAR